MTDLEEVVMTPLQAPEVGTTVLKVERVSRQLLDPRTVHYVAGGRYKGIVINRAANEKPDYRGPHVLRNFTCYIGSKLRGEPMREQRQLRFWFGHGTSDMGPMADRFFKELINPHLFPRDYIGYVKRVLQLLQSFPTVSKMELEMRPARPDEEDQMYVVRRLGRHRSQPPPGVTQDDYHTWHSPRKAVPRGEIGSPVGVTLQTDRGVSLDRLSRRGPSQEDARPYAQRTGNVITQWPNTQDSIIDAVNGPGLSRTLDTRRRYSIESLDSADFRAPADPYRVYTSSPRTERKAFEVPLPEDVPYSPNRESLAAPSDVSISELSSCRLSIASDVTASPTPDDNFRRGSGQTRRSIRVLKMGRPPPIEEGQDIYRREIYMPKHSRAQPEGHEEPDKKEGKVNQNWEENSRETTEETPEVSQTAGLLSGKLSSALPERDIVRNVPRAADKISFNISDLKDDTLQSTDSDTASQDDTSDASSVVTVKPSSPTLTWKMQHQEQRESLSIKSRSPSPAKMMMRRLPPSPIVSRVRSSPVTSRKTPGSTSTGPVVTMHTRTVATPTGSAHPGLSPRGEQLLWVARRYRVLKLLEDAYPNSVTTDELLSYYHFYLTRSRQFVDVVLVKTILEWLASRGFVKELDRGRWMRLETVRSAGHNMWSNITEIVTEIPKFARQEMPSVAIVTLLYKEKLAVDSMIDGKRTYVWRRSTDMGEGQVITIGHIGHIRVVSTKLPKPGEGESSMQVARRATTRVIGSFPTVARVLLVGVAGGIAHYTDDRRHIRRGDIIVCKPKQARSPMYIYCTGTERTPGGDYRFSSRNWVTKDETLENLIDTFQMRQKKDPNFAPWERYIKEGAMGLAGGDVSFRRPRAGTDRLVRIGHDGVASEVQHPMVRSGSARHMRPDQPVVHYDVIGGGEALLGDYNKRRTFAMLTGAKAIDPGYQPVLEAIEEAQKDSVAIIRGIADYSDGRSDSYWQAYAALAAAAFTKALLMELPIEN